MSKICLVTGGLGFIGSNLVDKLINDDNIVYVVDNLSTGSWENANDKAIYEIFCISNKEKLQNIISKIKPHWVFHLAALPRIQPSFEDPILHDEHNVRNTLKLLDICQKQSSIQAFINSSSSSIYGNPLHFPTSEDERVFPLSPYALQKYTSEFYIKILSQGTNFPSLSLRYFNPYGDRSFNPKNPLNAYSSVVGIFLNKKEENKPLLVFGNGEQSRDFIHVSDVVSANIFCAINIEKLKHEAYNVGFGETIKIVEVANIISGNIIFERERPGEASITWADINKLKNAGWSPKVHLKEYLKDRI
jgi:UDP-glucose 4-epimerase